MEDVNGFDLVSEVGKRVAEIEARVHTFAVMKDKLIATNETAYQDGKRGSANKATREYTREEITRILANGSTLEQQQLSLNYFYLNGFYRRIILHLAVLLKYAYILVPHVKNGKKMDNAAQRKYFGALDFLESVNIPDLCTTFAWKALVNGTYYGLLMDYDKNKIITLDLPFAHCRTRFKDEYGNDIIEFDLMYFNLITDKEYKDKALKAYPKIISKAYNAYRSNGDLRWFTVPSDIGICFPLFDGKPLFLNVLPAAVEFEETRAIERQRDLSELKKILVQKIPHNNDGDLLFEPEEAVPMHEATVGMLRSNENVSVLTTYADVTLENVVDSRQTVNNTLKNAIDIIYAEAGLSREVFSSSGNLSLDKSIANAAALMTVLAKKIEKFLNRILNDLFGNGTISFKFSILPITWYNEKEYIDNSFKLAQSGYSLLLPSLALGISQRDILDLKLLENDTLKLPERLIAPVSAYTRSGTTEGGRPTKSADEKSDKTIKNEGSANNTGGGSDE